MGTLFHKTIQALISYALAILFDYKTSPSKNLHASNFIGMQFIRIKESKYNS